MLSYIFSFNNDLFNQMLNWCKNSAYHDDQSEIFFTSSPIPHQNANRTLPPPKFAIPNYNNHEPRKIKPESRKGIKTHFDRAQKSDKEVQVALPYNAPKCLVDCATQTVKIGVQLLKSQRNSNSFLCSIQASPKNQNQNSNLSKIQKSKYTNMLSSNLPKSIDYKNQINKQTKATYCLADTRDKANHQNRSRFYSAYGVESYHFPVPNRSQLRQENLKQSIKFENLPGIQPPSNSLNRIQDQLESQLTFSGKYRKMLKNVQSEFKLSQKKRSQKNFKQTPPKRILFNERQTIVSKYDHQKRDSQRSLVVEQSILYQPEIRSYFTPLTHAEQHSYYSFYLAKQNFIGMLVSIKQITINSMNRISEQLLIYKELQTRNQGLQGILTLYQTQIDRDCYMLIKEPFTQTVGQYLQNTSSLTEISIQLLNILQSMQAMGFLLREWIRMQDLVVCMGRVKVQSVGIFTLDRSCGGFSIEEALGKLRQEMLEQIC